MLSSSDNELHSFNKLHALMLPDKVVDENERFLCKYHGRSSSPEDGLYSFDKLYTLMILDNLVDEDDRFLCKYHSRLTSF